VDNIRQRMIDNTLNQFFFNNNVYVLSSEHQSIYLSAYKIFLDNKISGIGPKNYRIECLKDKYKVVHSYMTCPTHPHNTYIQLLAETGILGFLFILGLFFLISYLLIRKKLRINYSFQDRNLYIFLLISCFISLWPLTPTGNFFNNWLNIIYFFPIGFILYFIDKNKIKT
jgi:O-antigen ligase